MWEKWTLNYFQKYSLRTTLDRLTTRLPYVRCTYLSKLLFLNTYTTSTTDYYNWEPPLKNELKYLTLIILITNNTLFIALSFQFLFWMHFWQAVLAQKRSIDSNFFLIFIWCLINQRCIQPGLSYFVYFATVFTWEMGARGPAADCRRSKASMLEIARAYRSEMRRFYNIGVTLSVSYTLISSPLGICGDSQIEISEWIFDSLILLTYDRRISLGQARFLRGGHSGHASPLENLCTCSFQLLLEPDFFSPLFP